MMDIAFQAIGIEVPNEAAFDRLVEDVGVLGEASSARRDDGTIHGRCLKIGKGLEVWTVLYEPRPGEVIYADCRPGFRARRQTRVSPWVMTEFSYEGLAYIHGYVGEGEVLFKLQNLTELDARILEEKTISVGLCGLAYQAVIVDEKLPFKWENLQGAPGNMDADESDWRLGGRIVEFESIRNPRSGSDLFWFRVELKHFVLEIVANEHAVSGASISVGSYIEADVWLQGHISRNVERGYEGHDSQFGPADRWSVFRRPN